MKKLKTPYTKKSYQEIAELFKVMANAKRLEILHLLSIGETNVNEIVKEMGVRKSNVSQHLALLRYMGLVTTRREGKKVFYKVSSTVINKLISPFHRSG